jgi:hypothetical protein
MNENEEITIEQIKAFVEVNKDRADVVEYMATLAVEKPLNIETVNGYLGTIEGKNLLQPILDRYATQAIKTHDEKQKPIIDATVKSRINEELIKLNPTETPEQRRIRELEEKDRQRDAQWEREKLNNLITSEFAKRNVPLELAKDIPYPSVEHATNVALVWEQIIAKEKEKAVNDFALSNAVRPGNGQQEDKGGDPTKGMTHEQLLKYYEKDAEARNPIPVNAVR